MPAPEITAREVWHITTSESRLFTLDFGELLASGETINAVSGTNGGVTLGVSADAAITIGTPSINSGALTYTDADGESQSIAAGKGVQVRLSAASGVAGTFYPVTFTVATSDSNRLQQIVQLQVVS
jgi:hypothetical protein